MRHVMPAGVFGAVRPVGAILPTAFAHKSRGRLCRSEGLCRHDMSYIFVISKVQMKWFLKTQRFKNHH